MSTKTNSRTKKVSAKAESAVLDALQVVFGEAQAEFEASQAEKSAEWDKELARKKEEDLYQFNKEKRDREDALQQELAKRANAVAERESAVSARESSIGDAEVAISQLQKQVDAIPVIVAKAETVSYERGKETAKREADSEIRLIQAEHASDKKVLEHALKAIQGTVQTQEQTIETLRDELKAANARVEAIATNAVTAAGQSRVTVNAAQSK